MLNIIIFLLLLLLLLYHKINKIWIVLLFIIIFTTNLYNVKITELFKIKKSCPNWEFDCYKKYNCGWCIDKNVNGKCVRGNKSGPKYIKKQKCSNWWYRNKCIYGNQCKPSYKPPSKSPDNIKKDENWEKIFNTKKCVEFQPKYMVP